MASPTASQSRMRTTALALASALLLAGCGAGWPGSQPHGDTALTIYSSTDRAQFDDVVNAFARSHPGISIRYEALSAREVYERTRHEIDKGLTGADLVINSSMDLQIKLVNDGYAQTYASPQRGKLPNWAVWKNQAYAVSSEPIVIGYNKRLIAPADLPRDHDELASLLHRKADMFRGRVAMYDPTTSPTGYLFVTQDLHIDRDNWDLIASIGLVQPRLYTSTAAMIDDLKSGKLLLAYNLIGSYALDRARRDPDFGVIIPRDYVLVGSRVALIARNAEHPRAAQQFLDFILSSEGQTILAGHGMVPLRQDVARNDPLVGAGNIRAIHVGPALMAGVDQINRERFFTKWNSTVRASGDIAEKKNGKGQT